MRSATAKLRRGRNERKRRQLIKWGLGFRKALEPGSSAEGTTLSYGGD